jgi:predicted HicB family RNase H-like nuclease
MTKQQLQKRGRELLDVAKGAAAGAESWIEVHNAVFGIGAPYGQLFPTQGDRVAFGKSAEHKAIMEIIDGLRSEKGDPEPVAMYASANGHVSLRLPKTVHAALLAEAAAEGVSLNQLCLTKLAMQLVSMV